ncbi:MAG: dockerin type I domain-containing protein, partial [Candidatus Caenarcaniphilales bacterium]|nr:dockerin type I domain-containing protein [Candidatus Caenarcaniphilales bacterium]
ANASNALNATTAKSIDEGTITNSSIRGGSINNVPITGGTIDNTTVTNSPIINSSFTGGLINGATLKNVNITGTPNVNIFKLVAPDGSPDPAAQVDNEGRFMVGTQSAFSKVHFADPLMRVTAQHNDENTWSEFMTAGVNDSGALVRKWGIGSTGDKRASENGGQNKFFIHQYSKADDSTLERYRFTIDNDGQTGINTMNPTSLLDVGGGVKNNIDGVDDLLVKGDAEIDGTIYATAFRGDGSRLTGIAPAPNSIKIDDLADGISDSTSVFLGSSSGSVDDGDNFNIGIGIKALNRVTSGSKNIAIGYMSGNGLTNNVNNISIGFETLKTADTTNGNIVLGNKSATDLKRSSNSLFVGNNLNLIEPPDKYDVNQNGYVDPADANEILAHLEAKGPYLAKYDINSDNLLTPSDALRLINYLNSSPSESYINENQILIGNNLDTRRYKNYLNIGNIIFGNNIDGTGTTLSTGNIGIGTSIAKEKLEVAGNVKAIRFIGDGSGLTGIAPAPNTIKIDDLSDAKATNNSLFIGDGAGDNSSLNNDSVALGLRSLRRLTTGTSNIAIGNYVMNGNTTGSYNIGVGSAALFRNTTGSSNTALGFQALKTNSIGNANTAIGGSVMDDMVEGNRNTGVGWNALGGLIRGDDNTATGFWSGGGVVTANGNSAYGNYSLMFSNGENNVAIGFRAGARSTNSNNTVAIGAFAGSGNIYGFDNTTTNGTYLGYRAGSSDTGVNNITIGYKAGEFISSGANNVIIGSEAGSAARTGSNNILLGARTNPSSETISNQLNIGNTLYGDLASKNIGIGTTTPSEKLEVAGNVKATKFIGDASGLTGISVSKLAASDGSPDTAMYATDIGQIIVGSDTTDTSPELIIKSSEQPELMLSSSKANGYTGLRFADLGGVDWSMVHNWPDTGSFTLYNHNSPAGVSNHPFTATQGGNVGIGFTAPTEKLEVGGNIKTNCIILQDGLRICNRQDLLNLIAGYRWEVANWGTCDIMSRGTQSRTVSCKNSLNQVVADSNCDAASKPTVSQSCDVCTGRSGQYLAGIPGRQKEAANANPMTGLSSGSDAFFWAVNGLPTKDPARDNYFADQPTADKVCKLAFRSNNISSVAAGIFAHNNSSPGNNDQWYWNGSQFIKDTSGRDTQLVGIDCICN